MSFDFLDFGFPKSGTDWKSINGKPYITVSTKGRSNQLSNKINDGADFGPDTTLGATSPNQIGPPYSPTLGIQEAGNYVKAQYSGGKVILKAGNYNVAPISMPDGVDLEGENITIHDGGTPFVTAIIANSGISTDNLITYGGSRGGSVRNLFFQSNVTLNSLLYFNALQGEVVYCTFYGNNVAKSIDIGPSNAHIRNNFFANTPTIAHIYVEGNGNDIYIENNFISQEGGTNSSTAVGIYVTGSQPGDGYVLHNPITGMGIGILLTGNSTMVNWKFIGNTFDGPKQYGLQIIPNGGTLAVEAFTFIGNEFDSAGINAINIQSSSTGQLYLESVKFTSNIINRSTKDGVYISGYSSSNPIDLWSDGLTFNSDSITDNSFGNSNLYSNVNISGYFGGDTRLQFLHVINTASILFNGYRYIKYGYSLANIASTNVVNIIGGNIMYAQTSYIDSITSAIGILKDVNIINASGNLVYLTPTTPAVPASGTAQQNVKPYPVNVYLYGGTVTEIQITKNGTANTVFSNSTGLALSGQVYKLNPSDSITITYTTAPTWNWLSD